MLSSATKIIGSIRPPQQAKKIKKSMAAAVKSPARIQIHKSTTAKEQPARQ
jgi:hypothetical protein